MTTTDETVDAAATESVPPAAAAAKRQRQKETTRYVLQVAYPVETPPDEDENPPTTETAWFDVWTGTVPAGTKRSTVRERALGEWGEIPPLGAEPLRTRLLDEDSAEETPVDSHLQLRIGGGS
jgi:hypothetical protein